jgi:hypothetical protein
MHYKDMDVSLVASRVKLRRFQTIDFKKYIPIDQIIEN